MTGNPMWPEYSATRRELTEALPGVLDVDAEVDESAVKAVRGRYGIGWRLAGAS